MHCKVCPYWPHVRTYLPPYPYCGVEARPKDGIDLTREGLAAKCTACQNKALKADTHLSYDAEGGRLHGEISFDDTIFAPGTEQGDFTTDPAYLAQLRSDTSDGCTKLPPEAEDALRKAVADAVSKVNVRDAAVFLLLLKKESMAYMRRATRKTHTRREFAEAVRHSLEVIEDVKMRLCFFEEGANESRKALGQLVKAICEMLKPHEAPILLGMMQGMSLSETARVGGLKTRATAHARARAMLKRLPQLKTLQGLSTGRHLATNKGRERGSGSALCGEIDTQALPRR